MNKHEFIMTILIVLAVIIVTGMICFTVYKVKFNYTSNGYEYVGTVSGSWRKVRSAVQGESASTVVQQAKQ